MQMSHSGEFLKPTPNDTSVAKQIRSNNWMKPAPARLEVIHSLPILQNKKKTQCVSFYAAFLPLRLPFAVQIWKNWKDNKEMC